MYHHRLPQAAAQLFHLAHAAPVKTHGPPTDHLEQDEEDRHRHRHRHRHHSLDLKTKRTLMYVDSPLSIEIQIQVITTTHVCKIQSGYYVLCKDTIATNPPILLVPVKISHHLLGCERKICPPVWVAPWSTSTSWSKTAGDVPSCPCGPSGQTPPPFFYPPPSLQTAPHFISAQHPSGPLGRIYSSVCRAVQKEFSGAQSKFPTCLPNLLDYDHFDRTSLVVQLRMLLLEI